LVTICMLLGSISYGQALVTYPLPAGIQDKAWLLGCRFSLFPDTGRAKGHTYRRAYFPAEKHYNDSYALVFVPDFMDNTQPCDFVHWFHGWYNNIDSSVRTFRLLEQFYVARRNAVFIFPEGPVNAPDSYAGKWESPNYFLPFTAEWWETLRPHTPQLTTLKRGKQVFAGHSGAYRVIAKNLLWADEVLLFDGLYGETDQYLAYCKKPTSDLCIFTPTMAARSKTALPFCKYLTALA